MPKNWNAPATKWEVAQCVGETTIALRLIQASILSLRNGNPSALSENLDELEKQADKLWAQYEKLTEEVDGGE